MTGRFPPCGRCAVLVLALLGAAPTGAQDVAEPRPVKAADYAVHPDAFLSQTIRVPDCTLAFINDDAHGNHVRCAYRGGEGLLEWSEITIDLWDMDDESRTLVSTLCQGPVVTLACLRPILAVPKLRKGAVVLGSVRLAPVR